MLPWILCSLSFFLSIVLSSSFYTCNVFHWRTSVTNICRDGEQKRTYVGKKKTKISDKLSVVCIYRCSIEAALHSNKNTNSHYSYWSIIYTVHSEMIMKWAYFSVKVCFKARHPYWCTQHAHELIGVSLSLSHYYTHSSWVHFHRIYIYITPNTTTAKEQNQSASHDNFLIDSQITWLQSGCGYDGQMLLINRAWM